MGGKKKKKSKEAETPLFEGSPELVSFGSFFHRWCQRQNVIPKFDLTYSGKPPKILFSYDLSVENIPFVGHGEAYKKKEAYSRAIINFIPHLIQMGLLKPEECPTIEVESEEEIKKNGSWTEENSKYRLNRFFFINRINVTVNFRPADTTSERNLGMICEMSACIPHIDRTIVGIGKALSKSSASKKSAKNFIRQLYHLDLVEAFSESEKKPLVPPSDVAPELFFQIPPQIEAEIDNTLKSFGIEPMESIPKVIGEGSSPISITTDTKMEEISPPIISRSSFDKSFPLRWTPPKINFNTWSNELIIDGPFHNLSLDKISQNLKEASKNGSEVAPPKDREAYPIFSYKQQILNAINANSVTIIRGNPGCGKTTQVCQYILDHYIESGRGAHCNIIVASPSSGASSGFPLDVAAQRGEELGQSIGHYRKFGVVQPRPFGAIMFAPFNLLLRRMEFGLKGISHIIFDEFYLRDMFGDLILIILKYMTKFYPELRVIITTPPVNTTKLINYFEKPPPILEIVEQTFPVEEFFIEDFIAKSGFNLSDQNTKKEPQFCWNENKDEGDEDEELSDEEDYEKADGESPNKAKKESKDLNNLSRDAPHSETSKESLLELKKSLFATTFAILKFIIQMERSGDVLVIFSGRNIVLGFKRFLDSHHFELFSGCAYAAVYEGQPRHLRKKSLQPDPTNRRKIILTTTYAASSCPFTDVTYLVDSCREKQIRYGEAPDFCYTPGWTPKDILNMRKIRVSKARPANVFYLCSKAQYESFNNEIIPQMTINKIHELVILIKLLQLGSPASLLSEAFDPPPKHAIEKAFQWLKFMKFLDCNLHLTPYGQILARLPIDPRGSRTILLGCVFSCGDAALTIAASQYISSSIFYQHKTLGSLKSSFAGNYFSDHIALVNAFSKWELAKQEGDEALRKFCYVNRVNMRTAYSILNVKEYLKSILISSGLPEDNFEKKEYNVRGSDPNLVALIGVIAFGLHPSIAYYSSSRFNCTNKLMVENSRPAEFDFYSISSAFLNEAFPSSVFIFDHHQRKKYQYQICKNLTRISPVHMCILGNGKAELINSVVKLDGWLTVNADHGVIVKLLALRPIIFFLLDALLKTPNQHQQEKFNKGLKCIRELFMYTYKEMQTATVEQPLDLPPQNLPPAKRIKIEHDQGSI